MCVYMLRYLADSQCAEGDRSEPQSMAPAGLTGACETVLSERIGLGIQRDPEGGSITDESSGCMMLYENEECKDDTVKPTMIEINYNRE